MIPAKMHALVVDTTGGYTARQGFELREVPTPTLDESKQPSDPHQVLLKTLYAGVCGSDKGLWYRNAFSELVMSTLKQEKKEWRVPGHEVLAEVVQLGSEVAKEGRLKVGDVVAAESHPYCSQCYQCARGEHHVCANSEIIGFSRDGGFAEYVKLPANILWKTDLNKIRPEVAVLQEPFGNAVHACAAVDMKDKTVLISGCGTIGLFALLVAKNLGAKQIIGLDPDPKHLEIAKICGADQVIKVQTDFMPGSYKANPATLSEVMKLTGGVGVDVALEMAGFNNSVNHVIQATRKGGHVILFGLKGGDFSIENFERMVVDGKTLHCIVGRRIPQTWELTQKLMETHRQGIQDKIWDVVLRSGRGSIMPLHEFSVSAMDEALKTNSKILLKIAR